MDDAIACLGDGAEVEGKGAAACDGADTSAITGTSNTGVQLDSSVADDSGLVFQVTPPAPDSIHELLLTTDTAFTPGTVTLVGTSLSEAPSSTPFHAGTSNCK